MHYLILANETAEAFAARTDPERSGEYWSAWTGYIDALVQSGVMRSAGGLEVFIQGCTVGSAGLSNWYMLSSRLCTAAQLRFDPPPLSASAVFLLYLPWNCLR